MGDGLEEWRRLSGERWRSLVASGPASAEPGPGRDVAPLAALVAALGAPTSVDGVRRVGPVLVGVAGGVASGKSVVAEALAARLVDEHHRQALVVSTDGFLYPNAELDRRGLTARKGYPETYDYASLRAAVVRLERGDRRVEVPVYDHLVYDVLPGRSTEVGGAEVVIVEGLNVLEDPPGAPAGSGAPSVADQLDLGVYVDAAEPDLRAWYRRRVSRLRAEATGDGSSFYDAFAGMDDATFGAIAERVWETVNLPNLVDHVEPSRDRADLVVVKASDHSVHEVVARTPRARALVAALARDTT